MSKTTPQSPTVFLFYGLVYLEVVWARTQNPNSESRRAASFSLRMFYKDPKEGEVELGRINKLCLLSGIDPDTQQPCVQIGSMYDGYIDKENDIDTRVFSNTFFPAGNGNKKNYTLYREFVERATDAVKAFIQIQAESFQRTQEARNLQRNSPSPQLAAIKALGAKFIKNQPAKSPTPQGSD